MIIKVLMLSALFTLTAGGQKNEKQELVNNNTNTTLFNAK